MPLSQQNRSLSVSTPLGEDVLLLRSMKGKERLSTLFEYQLKLVGWGERGRDAPANPNIGCWGSYLTPTYLN